MVLQPIIRWLVTPKCKACGRENGPLIEGKCASCTGLGV